MPISGLSEFDMSALHKSCWLQLLDIAAAIAVRDVSGARGAWGRYETALRSAEHAGGNLHTACSTAARSWRSTLATALRIGNLADAEMAVEAYTRLLFQTKRTEVRQALAA